MARTHTTLFAVLTLAVACGETAPAEGPGVLDRSEPPPELCDNGEDDDGDGRDGSGRATAITGPYGHVSTLNVGDDGWLRSVVDPLGGAYSFDWHEDGLLRSFTDPTGATSTFDFQNGRLTSDQSPEGNTIRLDRAESLAGDTVTVRGPRPAMVETYGVTPSRPGDGDRERVGVSGLASLVVGDSETQQRTLTMPDGTTVQATLASDPRFGMAAPYASRTVVELAGGRGTYTIEQSVSVPPDTDGDARTLDAMSRSLRMPGGREWLTEWDGASRTLLSRSPTGLEQESVFDDRGLLIESRPPGLAPVRYDYHPDGSLWHVRAGTGAAERTWAYEYEGGAVSAVTDPTMRTVTYARDLAMRPTDITAGARSFGLGYDEVDRVTSFAPPGRPAHGLSYTPSGAFDTYSPPAGGDPGGAISATLDEDLFASAFTTGAGTTNYHRDPMTGRLDAVTLGRGRFSNEFDAFGRVEAVVGPNGGRIELDWDGLFLAASRSTGVGAGEVAFDYDPVTFEVSAWTVNGVRVDLDQDLDGVLSQVGDLSIARSPTSGAVTASTLGTTRASFAHNEFGEPMSRTYERGATVLFEERVLERDAIGRVARERVTVSGVAHLYDYAYDEADRLFEVREDGVPVEHYDYHPNGARTGFTRGGTAGTASSSP